ncbi:tandem-95 repeat protein [uncultured Desulfuromonas sp.]|uniref:tandem-95 repeat protein n=1 Tax=uncultured Desulfuromonas sp. TaxID=181013 RepID=UPI002AAA6855|nr:Ig-like domain-containing protein [uncultured Desulfuromonas sp.]
MARKLKWFSKRLVSNPSLSNVKDYAEPLSLEPRFLYDASGVSAALSVLADAAFDGDSSHSDGHSADAQRDAEPLRETVQSVEALIPENALGASEHTVVIVDPSVPDSEQLLALLGSDSTVYVLGADDNGLEQVQRILADNPQTDTVHILSHGADDMIRLGDTVLNHETVSDYGTVLQQWGDSLSENADILFYGCSAAQSREGQSLFEQVARWTNADVAASVDITGAHALGGDWDLEYAVGNIESLLPVSPPVLESYHHVMEATAVTDANSDGQRVTAEDTELAIEGISITDMDAPETMTVRIQTTGGTSSLVLSGDVTVTSGTISSADFSLSGSFADINATLNSLAFTNELNQNSSTGGYSPQIVITARDVTNDGIATSLTVDNISVSAVNDAPVLNGDPLLVDEGGSASFSLAQLADSADALDADIATGQQVLAQQMITINSLPTHGVLTYQGGVVAVGQVIPVTDLGQLLYSHTGGDLASATTESFAVTVSDGGGGQTSGTLDITLLPQNAAPSISGSPSLIEGQVKVVAPGIDLGDSYDTLTNSTITISNIVEGGQGTLFIDANGNNQVDSGEELSGTVTLTATQRANLATQLKFFHNGEEPNAPTAVTPSFQISVTDAGGGEGGAAAQTTSETIEIDISPNNDDPTLTNSHPTEGAAHGIGEGTVTILDGSMLQAADQDLNPADLSQTIPANQLVYTIETRPDQGEIQLKLGATGGYDDNGWLTLGEGGRFTQEDIDAGNVRYVQTTALTTSDTITDAFGFTLRDSAFGYDVWGDPANPTGGREGGLRDAPEYAGLSVRSFYLTITGNDDAHVIYEGDPREATAGYGTSPDQTLDYEFKAIVTSPGNTADNVAPVWNEANIATSTDGGYVITQQMLEYEITRTAKDTEGTELASIVLPADETVYTLTQQPPNGELQRFRDGGWETIATYGQFTQDDINNGLIRFVHDGSENHTATFGYTVSDGTADHYSDTFDIDVAPTNDRPTAGGGTTQVDEGDGNAVRLGTDVLGMDDIDLSMDAAKQVDEGAEDFLWFKITDLPDDGTLQRWNGSAWVAVDTAVWLPATLLTAAADGESSGLRYVHDGSEPLTYAGGPKVTFNYVVRDDLADPADPLATDASAPDDISGSTQSNQSEQTTATINIIPVNDAPQVADRPGDGDPTIGDTITDGGATTGTNVILADIPEGGNAVISSAFLTAIDPDNTTVQRQYRITESTTEGTLLLNGKTLGVGSTFTQSDIDSGNLTYRHNGDEVAALTSDALGTYHDKFHFVVNDGVAEDSGSGADDNVFLMTFSPMNDLPTVEAPNSLDVLASGSTAVAVAGITVDDIDLDDIIAGAEEDFLRVEIEVLDGSEVLVSGAHLAYSGADPSSGSRAYVSGKATNALILQGTKAEVQAALDALTVAFDNDEDSSAHKIRVTVDDRLYDASGNLDSGANGGNSATNNTDGTPINADNNRLVTEITLTASNSNDVPTITNGSAYSVNEDAAVTLNGFTLSDVDSFDNQVSVTVQLFNDAGRTTLANTATQGTLTYSGLSNVTATGTNTVTLSGTLANVQTALNQIQFKGATDYNGAATGNGTLYLETTLTDAGHADVPGGNSVTVDNDITIVPVNDAPVLTVPGNQAMASGSAIDLSGFAVQDTRDTAQGATDYIEVTVDALDGAVAYGTLTVQTPGSATVDNNGTSSVTVKGTSAEVGAALNSLRYTPADANVDKVITIKTTADDRNGGVGNGTEGTGVDGNNTDVETFTIAVSNTNEAPVLTVPSPISVAEDSSATTVSGISYTDSDDFGGDEQVTVSVDHGSVDFGTKTGLSVVSGGYGSSTVTISGTKQELNTALGTLTYTPTADYHGGDTLTVTVDDQGLVGAGGAQSDTETIAITVTPVNDRPVATTNVTLAAVSEDSTPSGVTFSSLNFAYSDATDDQTANSGNDTSTANSYVAIVGNAAAAAQGTWQVSDGSGGWIDIPASGLSVTNALVFDVATQVRFVPAADFNGTPGSLNVRLADSSQVLTTSTAASDLKNLNDTANGDADLTTGAWNSANRTISISVTALNDAPTSTGSDPTITVVEDAADPSGQTVSALFSGNYSDAADAVTDGSSANALAGVAITGLVNDKGVWQYSTDGGTSWSGVTSVADTNALVLAATDQLRFLPTTANYNGTPGDSLTVRLIDASNGAVVSQSRVDVSGVNSGGTTAYSDSGNSVALGAAVTPQNDVPTLTSDGATSDIAVTATESAAVTGSANAFEVSLLSNVAVTDLDLATTSALDGSTFGGGSVTVTLADKIPGDLLTVDDSLGGISSVTAYDSATGKLVVNLAQDATIAQVQTILEAVKYAHQSDDPTALKSGTADNERAFSVVLSDGNNVQSGGNAGGPAPLEATVSGTITISAVNDPPVATDNTNSVTEDVAAPVTGNVIDDDNGHGVDSDPDTPTDDLKISQIVGDGGSAAIASGSTSASNGTEIQGKYGTLTIGADGSYSYDLDDTNPTVNALATGQQLTDEVFTYTLSDGTATATATLTVTINGHSDGDPQIVAVDGNAGASGEASVAESGLRSTGDNAETTTGVISVTAPDGIATVTIGGQSFTIAQLQSYSTAGPSAVIDTGEGLLRLTGLTNDGGPSDAPTQAGVHYTYTLKQAQDQPGADESTDSIFLAVTDKKDVTGEGTLTVAILDDVPTAVADSGTVLAGQTLDVSAANGVLANDTAGADGWHADGAVVGVAAGNSGVPVGGVAMEIVGAHGTLTLHADGSYSYAADPNAAPLTPQVSDDFIYTVRDADGDETTALLTITVVNNRTPDANNDARTTPEDTPISGNVISGGGDGDVADGDDDGDTLTVTQIRIDGTTYTVPENGSVSVDLAGQGTLVMSGDGSYGFTPVADWHGTVPGILYTVSDGTGADNGTATARLDIVVTPVVDIADDAATTRVNQPVTTPVLDNDSFEGTPRITAFTPPGHGTVTDNGDGTLTYTPEEGYTGSDSYTYTVTSGGVTETATVTISVTNDALIANDDARTTPEDTPISGNVISGGGDGDVADSDGDGDTLTVTQIRIDGTTYAVPENGSVSVDLAGQGTLVMSGDGSYDFTPVADWHGTVPGILYTVSDGTGADNGTATARLDIVVTPVVDIADDAATTRVNQPVTTPVLDNDSFEGTPRITAFTPPGHGTVTDNGDGTLTYTPDEGYTGSDSYTYTVTSGGVTESATVTLDVTDTPTPDPDPGPGPGPGPEPDPDGDVPPLPEVDPGWNGEQPEGSEPPSDGGHGATDNPTSPEDDPMGDDPSYPGDNDLFDPVPHLASVFDAEHRKADYDLVLDMEIHDQMARIRETFSYKVPDSTFAIKLTSDAPLDETPRIHLKAQLASGAPLPEWLHFKPESATFSGTPPEGMDVVDVKVIAYTEDGQEAEVVFSIIIQPQKTAAPGANDTAGEGEDADGPSQPASGTSEIKAEGIAAGLSLSLAGLFRRPQRGVLDGVACAESCRFERQRRQLLEDLGLHGD